MLKSFFLEKKWRLWAWGGLALLIASLWLQVQMTVAINSWYGKFYDLLQNAGDYVDKPQEGINLFFSQLVSLRFILGMLTNFFSSALLSTKSSNEFLEA